MEDIGALTHADEGLCHQIADTFAVVGESDRGWTEKIWGAISRKDGRMQVNFGLGRYANRNVVDGHGGISRGMEQWTVRASRALAPGFDTAEAGPLHYEIVEPLRKVRFRLDANDVQPIAFDVLFDGILPPFFEKRSRRRTNNRIASNVVRYHQIGTATGWVELAGERIAIDDEWFAVRDHSWGMRGDAVGIVPTDIQPVRAATKQFCVMWGTWLLPEENGDVCDIHHLLIQSGDGDFRAGQWDYLSAYVNRPDGTQEPVASITAHPVFDKTRRLFLAADMELVMQSGRRRSIRVEAAGDSGFFLRTGEYGEWKGGRHGAWRGALHSAGEYIPDIGAMIDEVGQFRDTPVIVREGASVGYGLQETIFVGEFPSLGLDASSDFPPGIV